MRRMKPENNADQDEPKEFNRGWYFPVSLVRLYEAGQINAEQMMLLGKINTLQHPKRGCYASNQWLAKWWGKHATWVSENIGQFVEMGLVSVRLRTKKGRTERQIRVTYAGDTPLEKTRWGIRENSVGALRENSNILHDTSYHTRKQVVRAGARSASFGLVGVDGNSKSAARLCKLFQTFTIKHNLHVGRKPPNLRKWRAACDELIEANRGDTARVKEVMVWYFENFRNEYLPTCYTLLTFCSRFLDIEKARARELGIKAPTEQIKVYVAGVDDEAWERDTGEKVTDSDEDDED